jgi:hypothetical protein
MLWRIFPWGSFLKTIPVKHNFESARPKFAY